MADHYEPDRHRHDAAWKERDLEPLRTAAEIEASIRHHCRQHVASHLNLLRRAGILTLGEVHERLRGDIAHLRRIHSQSVARERTEARRTG